MSLKLGLPGALRSLLAMALAFVVVVLINVAGGELADTTGFPGGGQARLAWDLVWFFIAGMLATCVVTRLAPSALRAHAIIFFVLMLVIGVLAVAQLGGDWPRWFSAGILLAAPLQAGLGAWWARRKAARMEPGSE